MLNSACFGHADVKMCDKMIDHISIWCHIYAEGFDSKTENPNAVLARTFMTEMLNRARSDWWPNLNRLQIRQLRVGVGRAPELTALKDAWIQFGKTMGLSAKKERARHEREAHNHCAWRGCKHHHEKPAGITLFMCKGCGDVRYCGRECQKRYVCRCMHRRIKKDCLHVLAIGRKVATRCCAGG